MKLRNCVTLVAISAVLFVVGCGGDSDPDPASTGGTAGTGGAAGTGGVAGTGGQSGSAGSTGGTGGGAQNCRTYMTSAVAQMGSQQGDVSCTFDTSTSAYVCEVSAGSIKGTSTLTYESTGDFIAEVGAVGKVTCLTDERINMGDDQKSVNTYDAQGRLLTESEVPDGYVKAYTGWDATGRPISGNLDAASLGCTGVTITVTYEDGARTKLETYDASSAVGSCPTGQPSQIRFTYDEDGNMIHREHSFSGTMEDVVVITVNQSDTICE